MAEKRELETADGAAPRDALAHLILAYRVSQSICVAARLGLADALKEGPKSPEELARACGADPGALSRLLRVLASVGIFTEQSPGRVALTPLGALLQADVPGSLRAWASAIGEMWWWRPWGELLYSVRTGDPAFNHVFGVGFFEYLAQNSDAAQAFNATMTGSTAWESRAVMAAYDFSTIHTLVDVGGGQGALLAAILRANPHMQGVLFERSSVLEGARRYLETEGVAERCELVGGDFFQAVPSGGDAYLLKFVLHDWDDDRAVTILKNCRQTMNAGGRVLVVEMVIPPGNEPSRAKLIDLNMLVMLPGRERTHDEYRALFAMAGFRLTDVRPTQSPYSVIEGVVSC